MVELSMRGDQASIGFAGDVLNTAVYLKRTIGAAGDVQFVSVMGRDDFSNRMLGFIESHGVGTKFVGRHGNRTPGLYAISTDARGERTFAYWRDSSAARTLFQVESGIGFEVLDQFDVVYLSAVTLAILPAIVRGQLLAALENFPGQVAFDSNYRPRLWQDENTAREAVSRAWHRADIALPSVDDEMALFGDKDEVAVLQRFAGYGSSRGALKRGMAGPVSFEAITETPLFAAADIVVDTTAAGDSFNGGFLGSLLAGETAPTALQTGHALALKVISKPGAIVET